MRKLYTFCALLVMCYSAMAQGEANNWYFGINAGVTFNSGAPVALTNGALATGEGSATISDKNGNLLFYTDGQFVYNRNHTQMPNGSGLAGNGSSAQSAVIVPKPGSPTRFYIFTVSQEGVGQGVCYTEVDMTLDGGLGDITGTKNNVLLASPTSEKIAAVKHANGLFVWIIMHKMFTNEYYARLIDCNGVGPAVMTAIGQVENMPGWGYLTVSPNGRKLASAMCVAGFEVLDFDNATGVISNNILLGFNSGSNQNYGVSFSPDNNLLYGLEIGGVNRGKIYQWNLQAGSPANIIASVTTIGTALGNGPSYSGGAMQIGPDGKIYVCNHVQPFLSSINNPNVVGLGCNFQTNTVDLLGFECRLGLPPFIMSYFDTTAVISYTGGTCSGTPANFTVSSNTTFLDSVSWNFDDPASGAANTSNQLSPTHSFSAAGVYNVRLIRHLVCVADTSYIQVTVQPNSASSQTVFLCSGGSYTLPSGNVVTAAGTYRDTLAAANSCDSIVTTTISLLPPPQTDVYDTICTGETYTLPGGLPVTNGGDYTDTLNTAGGCDSIVITHLYVSAPALNVASTNILCQGAPMGTITATASGGATPYTYVLMQGAQVVNTNGTGNFSGLTAGSYSVIVTDNAACTASGNAQLTEPLPFNISYNSDAPTCAGRTDGRIRPSSNGGTLPHTYSATQDGANFWYANRDTIFDLAPGTYTVIATDNNGCTKTIEAIVPEAVPDSFVISADSTSCSDPGTADGAIHVFGTVPQNGPFQFSLDGGPLQYSGDFYTVTAGLHTVTAVNAGNCTTQLQIIVPAPVPIFAGMETDTITIALGQGKQVSVSFANAGNPSFSWQPASGLSCTDCANPVVNVYQNTTFTATVSVTRGTSVCSASAELHVIVLPVKPVFVPNSFTPNGDGNNDVFQVYGESMRTVNLKIFNQWGELVFETDNPFNGWDGTYKGRLELPQVYVYVANITFLDDTRKEEKGSLTLIR